MSTTARPTLSDALRLGRHSFRAGERIDMSALADRLGVNRVTLYRWIGSRDQFLVEVLWSLAEQALSAARAESAAQGAEGIVQVTTRFIEVVIADHGMQRWLSDEGEHAMRLLTRHDTSFQPRLIGAIQDLLEEEAQAGRLELPVDLHDLAYVIVRLIESYILPGPHHRPGPAHTQRGADPAHAAARQWARGSGSVAPPSGRETH